MSRCFGTRTTSSKEYINNKSNSVIFCDIRNRFIDSGLKASGNNIACVNDDGEIIRYKNNTTLINLAKAHMNFRTDERKTYYNQKFKDLLCPYALPVSDKDNTEKYSNGYKFHPAMLTTAEPGDTAQTREVQSWTRTGDDPENDDYDDIDSVNNRFAEIAEQILSTSTGTLEIDSLDGTTIKFPNGKKTDYTLCASRVGGRRTVILASEVPPPEVISITIIFE